MAFTELKIEEREAINSNIKNMALCMGVWQLYMLISIVKSQRFNIEGNIDKVP